MQPDETGQLCSATTCSITAVMVAGGWGALHPRGLATSLLPHTSV